MIYDITLKVRLIRARDKKRGSSTCFLDDRELLALELLSVSTNPLPERVLGRMIGVQTTSLADLVSRLYAKGLIQKEQSNLDRRKQILSLTPKGIAEFKNSKGRSTAAYLEHFAGIDEPKELEHTLQVLNQMDEVITRSLRNELARLGSDEDLEPKNPKMRELARRALYFVEN
jgi:DNA-binding MarR family transcriptional regulator